MIQFTGEQYYTEKLLLQKYLRLYSWDLKILSSSAITMPCGSCSSLIVLSPVQGASLSALHHFPFG